MFPGLLRTATPFLPAVYTLTRTPTHAKIIPRGVLDHTETDLFNCLIPQCLIFGMVRNDAYNGNVARNPFNFQLLDLQGVFRRNSLGLSEDCTFFISPKINCSLFVTIFTFTSYSRNHLHIPPSRQVRFFLLSFSHYNRVYLSIELKYSDV